MSFLHSSSPSLCFSLIFHSALLFLRSFFFFLSLYFIGFLIPSHIPQLSLSPPLIFCPFPLLSYSPVSSSLCFMRSGFPALSYFFGKFSVSVSYSLIALFFAKVLLKNVLYFLLVNQILVPFSFLLLYSCYAVIFYFFLFFALPYIKRPKAVFVKYFCITLIKANKTVK